MKFITPVDFQDASAPEQFTRSIVETGFGVLTQHPIDHGLIDQVYDEWKGFFASDAKLAYTYEKDVQAGYFPFGSENAKDSDNIDLKEFFHYYPWWEQNPLSQMPSTLLYFDQISKMALTLLQWIEEHTPDSVRSTFSCGLVAMGESSPQTFLRPIHYPPLTGEEKDGEVRAAAHEDINLLSLLPAATHPGLQVKDLQGNWHDVACDPGNIVVNSGDMLKEASGGYYPSTTHRVLKPTGAQAKLARYSLPLFLHARPEVRLSKRYTAQEYLQQRLQEIGLL